MTDLTTLSAEELDAQIEAAFPLGCAVRKKSGPEWVGVVVGYYSSTFTPEGLVIECTAEGAKGQVHVEPAKRMELAAAPLLPTPEIDVEEVADRVALSHQSIVGRAFAKPIALAAIREVTRLLGHAPKRERLTVVIEQLSAALGAVLKRDERNTCQHDETHRGGVLWEICDSCGAKWADDEGGRPEWQDPPEWTEARNALSAARLLRERGDLA